MDQVPLPFVNDMDKTYEEQGAKRVSINQLGPSLSKRQATGQLAFRPAVPPPEGCSDSKARELYDKYLQEQPAPHAYSSVARVTSKLMSLLPTLKALWCFGRTKLGWIALLPLSGWMK